jgi:hypothetical protein
LPAEAATSSNPPPPRWTISERHLTATPPFLHPSAAHFSKVVTMPRPRLGLALDLDIELHLTPVSTSVKDSSSSTPLRPLMPASEPLVSQHLTKLDNHSTYLLLLFFIL